MKIRILPFEIKASVLSQTAVTMRTQNFHELSRIYTIFIKKIQFAW